MNVDHNDASIAFWKRDSLSALDTLTGVLIGLVGSVPVAVVVYLLEESREAKRVQRETALRPLAEKDTALKECYYALVDLAVVMMKTTVDPQNNAKGLRDALDNFTRSVARTAIWLSGSPESLTRLTENHVEISVSCGKVISDQKLTMEEFNAFAANVGRAGGIIGRELRIGVLEDQLRQIVRIVR